MHLTVAEILHGEGRKVHAIGPEATAVAAAREMNHHRIGSLVVVDDGRLVGIVTERDILTKIVAAERPPAGTRVCEIMTAAVLTCTPSTRLEELRSLMRERRIRHVPVVEEGRLAGMVSIGDLNAAQTESLAETIRHMEIYIGSA